MDAPAFLMTARTPVGVEGTDLDGLQMDEGRMLQLRLKVTQSEQQHPLVHITTRTSSDYPTTEGDFRRTSSHIEGSDREVAQASSSSTTRLEELVRAAIDATEQGVTIAECAEQFRVSPDGGRSEQYLEFANWLSSYRQGGLSRSTRESIQVLALETELRRKALPETGTSPPPARSKVSQLVDSGPLAGEIRRRNNCAERGALAYRDQRERRSASPPLAPVSGRSQPTPQQAFTASSQQQQQARHQLSSTQGHASWASERATAFPFGAATPSIAPPSHGLARPAASQRPSLDKHATQGVIERRAGADEDEEPAAARRPPLHPHWSSMSGADEAGAVLKDIAAALSSQDRRAEEAALLQGTGFSEEDKLLMYLARGCDRFSVLLIPTEVGREFVKGMKKLFLAGTGEFRRFGWPCPPTNRILLGLAKLEWGGRDHRNLTSSALSVADFPTSRCEDLEQYVPPEDLKPEHRPRDPPTYLSWARQARNSIRAFACVYGTEHEEERSHALENLCRKHEQDDHKYPLDFVRGAWEELVWRWFEELKEELRRCRKVLGKEKMRRDELEFIALSPTTTGGAFMNYPRVFDLEDPQGYYQRVVEQRLQEKAQR
eukprot:4809862-Amphidinium_carterae.1